MGFGRILNLAFAEKRIGLLRDLEDLLHIEQTSLDFVFFLQEQNFRIDCTKHCLYLLVYDLILVLAIS